MENRPTNSNTPRPPYSAPDGYFYFLPQKINNRIQQSQKDTEIKSWLYNLPLATSSLSCLAIIVLLFIHTYTNSKPSEQILTSQQLSGVADEELIEFLLSDELLLTDISALAVNNSAEVTKELVSDVSEQELLNELEHFSNEELW